MRGFMKTVAACGMLTTIATAATAEIVLGVVAPRGELESKMRWDALATHVAADTGEPVRLMPVTPSRGLELWTAGELDVFLTNPVQAAIIRESGGEPIASLDGGSGPRFGGVIIANAAAGVATAADLKGKRVVTMPPSAGGGFIFQAAYLAGVGVSVPGDFAMHKAGRNLFDLVKLVERGVFDVAFVRTGVLERMAADGEIDMSKIVVVDERQTDGFAQRHTTPLYPNWFVVTHADVDPAFAEALQDSLLSLDPASDAAAAARITGFVEPLDITPIVDALRALRVAPFDS